jgi:hypothetical protein
MPEFERYVGLTPPRPPRKDMRPDDPLIAGTAPRPYVFDDAQRAAANRLRTAWLADGGVRRTNPRCLLREVYGARLGTIEDLIDD